MSVLLRPVVVGLALLLAAVPAGARAPLADGAPPRTMPNAGLSVKFAVIGDMGTGGARQRDIGRLMAEVRGRFPFDIVLTVGDNLYGSEKPRDYERKFLAPYGGLLDAGVRFHASLGNHDDPEQRFFAPFHMQGRRYYTFTRGPVQFFALDTTLVTVAQVRWLEQALAGSTAPWKVAYFHHPLYSSGLRHGPRLALRATLEPLLATYGVQAVFTGHEHFYERLVPQRGVQHFITGAGGRLRRDNIRRSAETASGFDEDNSFMLVEVSGERLHFEAIDRRGRTVDAGIVWLRGETTSLVATMP
ncbi:MAG: metallophosphoesterase [Acidobacteriota bacterium]